MRVLLDTHTFLWAAGNVAKLSPTAVSLLSNPETDRLLSIASAWEITIKCGTGKLSLPDAPSEFLRSQCEDLAITVLPITLDHLKRLETLMTHHRDPFDRLLIAQSLAEGVPILSADSAFDAYRGLKRLW